MGVMLSGPDAAPVSERNINMCVLSLKQRTELNTTDTAACSSSSCLCPVELVGVTVSVTHGEPVRRVVTFSTYATVTTATRLQYDAVRLQYNAI